ncbi:MAG: AAA family ATPase, partial [Succinivibrio sp.]|nr:AAA family ATPase [Succinivibrio sp.]
MNTHNELTNSGLENFGELYEDGGIYIDKTAHLKEIYAQHIKADGKSTIDKVLLFTRPRRFGKTLTLSMLKNFFELNYENPEDRSRAQRLFQGLAISEDKEFCNRHLGRYPVILISLKTISGPTYEKALQKALQLMGDLFLPYLNVLQQSDRQLPANLQYLNNVITDSR